MEINVKLLTETAQLPTRGSEYAAGYDLYADIPQAIKIGPHMTAKIATGLAMEIPEGYFGQLCRCHRCGLPRPCNGCAS